MLNQFSRTQLLIGADAIKKLSESRVAVFGIGGVGGYVCESYNHFLSPAMAFSDWTSCDFGAIIKPYQTKGAERNE